MRSPWWYCNVCNAQNHYTDGECQYCECTYPDCKRDNCPGPHEDGMSDLSEATIARIERQEDDVDNAVDIIIDLAESVFRDIEGGVYRKRSILLEYLREAKRSSTDEAAAALIDRCIREKCDMLEYYRGRLSRDS